MSASSGDLPPAGPYLSLRHGPVFDHAADRITIHFSDSQFDGYSDSHIYGESFANAFSEKGLRPYLCEPEEGLDIDSIDITQLSAHQRLAIKKGRL
ncbi:hypothetical protein [Roseovarius sp. D22-M7]|uniref:hypothetical protein n=1 Tax=Roseovarius sp. D22-M7 TaxID=3127116 RepID=UPI00300FFE1F